ncbi:hypothetical protein [Pseudomonas putida]
MTNQKLLEQFEAAFQAEFPTIYKAAKAGDPEAHGDMTCARWGWMASREALRVTNPFPVQMGDPDAAWAREVAEKSLRAQGLKVAG